MRRASRPSEVQRASAALVEKWGKQKIKLAMKEEEPESELCFSRTVVEPMPRA